MTRRLLGCGDMMAWERELQGRNARVGEFSMARLFRLMIAGIEEQREFVKDIEHVQVCT